MSTKSSLLIEADNHFLKKECVKAEVTRRKQRKMRMNFIKQWVI